MRVLVGSGSVRMQTRLGDTKQTPLFCVMQIPFVTREQFLELLPGGYRLPGPPDWRLRRAGGVIRGGP
eukprot:1911503-Alexandrium_andersonii.AAC.1